MAEFLPEGLTAVIARCLAKAPADRFSDYRALTAALAPFARQLEPARRVPRSLAFVIDALVLSLPQLRLAYVGFTDGFAGVQRVYPPATSYLQETLLMFVYFTVCEGRWGTTLGKAAFGLKVSRIEGGNPGWRRAAARAALFLGPGTAASLIARQTTDPNGAPLTFLASVAVSLGLMTARWPWGIEGWHDRLIATRVIRRFVPAAADGERVVKANRIAPAGRTIGPYVLDTDSPVGTRRADGCLRSAAPSPGVAAVGSSRNPARVAAAPRPDAPDAPQMGQRTPWSARRRQLGRVRGDRRHAGVAGAAEHTVVGDSAAMVRRSRI